MEARNNTAGAGRPGPRRYTKAAVDLEALRHVSGQVTGLTPLKRDPDRRAVEVDGSFAVSLHLETVVLAGLKVGRVVDGLALVQAVLRDLHKQTWDAALGLLAARARTSREVERALSRSYPAETVQQVLERLAAGGWLDDADLAHRYVQTHQDLGERRLLQDLTRRGVAREVALSAIRDGLSQVDATEIAREAAAQRLAHMPNVDRPTAQRRLAGYLSRRGYGFETIAAALGPLLKDLPAAPFRRMGSGMRGAGAEED